VYGAVPPLTVDVKATDWPVVGDAGENEKSTDNLAGAFTVNGSQALVAPALFPSPE